MSKDFFNKFKEYEKKSGLTQVQIGLQLGVSSKQVQNYGSKLLPPHDKLIELNKIFKTDLSVYIYQEKVPISINNNSDPPQELVEENKKLKADLENKEKTINNLNISLDELREKYNELKKGHPRGKTGTDG